MKKNILISVLLVGLVFFSKAQAIDLFKNEFEQNIATRISSIALVDPRLSVLVLDFLCTDATDQLNNLIDQSITTDGDKDGFIDTSLITQYATDQMAYLPVRSLQARFVDANCPEPLHTSACEIVEPTPYLSATTVNENQACLMPIDNTTSGYQPSVNTTSAPCFSILGETTSINVAGIELDLMGFGQALRYNGNLNLDQGLMMGFVSEANAEKLILPKNIPVVGGQPLASLLPGGMGNCSNNDDRDIFTDGKTSGWWFYFNTTAELIELE